MENKCWKICCTSYQGSEKNAVDLLYKELGNYIIRNTGVYSFHAIACEEAELPGLESNAVVLGCYCKNAILQKYISPEEVKKDGYVVKVMDNPENPQYKLALLCGDSPREVFYAAADFVDDYFNEATPSVDAYIHLRKELLEQKLPDYYISTAPAFKTRSVFTWGHPISDFRQYFEDLARLKLNQIIIWNDFLPLNAQDVYDCAHSYGLKLIWGYSWGWSFNCNTVDVGHLSKLRDEIVSQFNAVYKNIKCDGIYFQSFTELSQDQIDGMYVSQAVTELVNMTADAILKEKPGLRIQFGLHASSVKERLFDIAKVDERVEFIWEDCGGFPYKATPVGINSFNSLKEFGTQNAFADQIIDLRESGDLGLVYKCMLTMDWSRDRVTHQPGSYVLGLTDAKTKEHDQSLLPDIWRFFSAEWIKDGEYALALTRHVFHKTNGNINMCLAGTFIGGIWYPTALCAQMLWDCEEEYTAMRSKVLKRRWIRF